MTGTNDWFDDARPTDQIGPPETEQIDTSANSTTSHPRPTQETPMSAHTVHHPDAAGGEENTAAGAAAASPAPQPVAKGPRMSTVAWGLVLVLLGLVVIAVGLGIDLQLELVFIGILGVAGLTLLIGAIVGAGKRER